MRTSVNLAAMAELAVRLVNSGVCDASVDPLRSREALREFVADRPFLAAPVTLNDLDRLRLVRAELAHVFTETVHGDGAAAAERLNALLLIHPVQPVLAAHDGEPLHVHLSESGSVADRYAAASVVSLALLLSQLGAERFGICAIASCDRVFIDGSSNKSRRYCADHCAARTNVTSLPQRNRGLISEQSGTAATAVS
jgi:predicted RNA-binding Zn ribbon-like protein